MPTPTLLPDPAAAETIAHAWHTTRVGLARPQHRRSLIVWERLAPDYRATLIGTVEQLLAKGIILAPAGLMSPADGTGGLVDLELLETVFAAASALPWDVGSHVPRNLYAARDRPGISGTGIDIGRLDRAEDARAVVEWVNAWPAASAELRGHRAGSVERY